MLRANQVSTEGGPSSPFCVGLNLVDEEESQELSTKHMNYEQIMARLGKKTLKVKIKERREKEKADLQADHASSDDPMDEDKSDSENQIAGFLEDQSDDGSVTDKPDPAGASKSKDGTMRRKCGSKDN